MRLSRTLPLVLAAALALHAGVSTAAVPAKFSAAAAEVRDFVAVSATVGYAATMGGGVWKTSDAGSTWTRTSLPAKTVWKVSVNPNSAGARLYAATDTGLYRSTDAGENWTQLTQDPTQAVAVMPTSAAGNETILVGVRGVGILRSTDSGGTMTRASGLDSTDVTGLVWYTGSGTTALAVLQCNVEDAPAPLSGNWGGVFRSIDGGASWSAFNSGLPVVDSTKPCVAAVAANGTAGTPILVAGIKEYMSQQGGTYRITGAGTTWTASASNPLPYGVEFLGPDFANANGFFAGTNQFGTYRSADGGVNFGPIVNGGLDPDMATRAFAAGSFTATTWVAGIYGLGLFRTTTGGSPWSLPAGPIRADRVNDLANHNNTLNNRYWMALKNGGVMRSDDAGLNWSQFNAGLDKDFNNPGGNGNMIRNAETIAAHPANGSVVAVGIRTYGLYQINAALTGWDMVAGFTNPFDHKPQSLAITPGGRVFYSLFDAGAATPGGLFTSTATGTTIGTLASTGRPIFEANPGLGVASGAWRVRPSPTSPHIRVFLMMYDSLPYRSMDGGLNWARVTTTDVGFQRHSFIDIAEKVTAPLTLLGSTNKGIYKSTDDGFSWTRVPATGLASTALAAMVYAPNGVVFGGDFNGDLYCSVNDGANWVAVTGGALGAAIRDMKYLNGAVHVLTDGAGIWKKDSVCP